MMDSFNGPPVISEPAARAVKERPGCPDLFSETKETNFLMSSTFFGLTTSSGLTSKMLASWLNKFKSASEADTSPSIKLFISSTSMALIGLFYFPYLSQPAIESFLIGKFGLKECPDDLLRILFGSKIRSDGKDIDVVVSSGCFYLFFVDGQAGTYAIELIGHIIHTYTRSAKYNAPVIGFGHALDNLGRIDGI